MEVYQHALSDRESAVLLGLTKPGYQAWRRKHGLKANGQKAMMQGGSCRECQRPLRSGNTVGVCYHCTRKFREEKFFTVKYTRAQFAKLVAINPSAAAAIRDEIIKEDGEEIAQLATDGLLEKVKPLERPKFPQVDDPPVQENKKEAFHRLQDY